MRPISKNEYILSNNPEAVSSLLKDFDIYLPVNWATMGGDEQFDYMIKGMEYLESNYGTKFTCRLNQMHPDKGNASPLRLKASADADETTATTVTNNDSKESTDFGISKNTISVLIGVGITLGFIAIFKQSFIK